MLKPGENWRNLPKELQPEAMGNSYHLGGGKTGFYRRLDWDSPSPTVVTHPAMPATELAHPTENRPLSIQEYKRIQEFPDDWVIEGSLLDKYKQIGNGGSRRAGQGNRQDNRRPPPGSRNGGTGRLSLFQATRAHRIMNSKPEFYRGNEKKHRPS